MMSEPTTVDKTTVDELTGKIVLLIEENRPWHETELMHRQMSAKVKHYVRYIRGKKFAEEHGQRPQDTIVRLVSAERPGDDSIEFLRRVGYELSKHGIEFESQIGPHGIPIALTTEAPAVSPEITEIPPTPVPSTVVREPPSDIEQPDEEAAPTLEAAPEPDEPSFADSGQLEPETLDTPAHLGGDRRAIEEPSELEMLIDAGADWEDDAFAELDRPLEPGDTVGSPKGKKATRPTFFPEEEFGRALPDVDEVEAILMSASSEPAIIETSSGKRIVLDVEGASSAAAAAAKEGGPNLIRAVGAAIGAAVVGAILWAGLSIGAGHGASPLALVIGLMVGMSVRLRGNGHTTPFRVVGVACTLLGSLLGATLAGAALSAWLDGLGFSGIIANLSSIGAVGAGLGRQYGLLDIVSLALALYIAYKLSASKPSGENPKV